MGRAARICAAARTTPRKSGTSPSGKDARTRTAARPMPRKSGRNPNLMIDFLLPVAVTVFVVFLFVGWGIDGFAADLFYGGPATDFMGVR